MIFTIGMIGNKTGHLLECVELYGILINKSETEHMVKGSIAASSLKILWRTLYSVKYYDQSNLNVFTLSLWKNFRWGLIYFDQFKAWLNCHDSDRDFSSSGGVLL